MQNHPPTYLEVMDDLQIDPEEATAVTHEERFQTILKNNRSKLL